VRISVPGVFFWIAMKQRIVAAALGGALAAPALAQVAPTTLPTGGQVNAGSAVISTPAAGSMQIDQSSSRAIIDWQSFSIGSAASVRFNQPGTASVVLNRVNGGSASEIFGRLSSNGKVFLSNSNGVLFAPGASVEVGALFATTLSISNADFLADRYTFASNGAAGAVVNRGNIVTPNGYAALAAPQVRNEGVIVARLGTVTLAAGDRVTLNMVDGSLISVTIDQAALNASIVNSGTLQADGGRVLLTASSANALLDTVINNTGTIRATRLEERDGQIVLQGGANGTIRSSGMLDADNMILDAGEAHISEPPGLPMPPSPLIGAGPVIAADPGILRIDMASQREIFAESFSISATTAVQFAQPPASMAILSSVPMSTTPIAPAYGTLTLSNSIGLLSPVPHSVVGTGVTLPTDFLRAQ
jgi:filamentous hemagglutinin family protein